MQNASKELVTLSEVLKNVYPRDIEIVVWSKAQVNENEIILYAVMEKDEIVLKEYVLVDLDGVQPPKKVVYNNENFEKHKSGLIHVVYDESGKADEVVFMFNAWYYRNFYEVLILSDDKQKHFMTPIFAPTLDTSKIPAKLIHHAAIVEVMDKNSSWRPIIQNGKYSLSITQKKHKGK